MDARVLLGYSCLNTSYQPNWHFSVDFDWLILIKKNHNIFKKNQRTLWFALSCGVWYTLPHREKKERKEKALKKRINSFQIFMLHLKITQNCHCTCNLQRYIYFQLFFKHLVEISQTNKVSIKFHRLIIIIQFALVVLRPKLLKSSMEKINFQFICHWISLTFIKWSSFPQGSLYHGIKGWWHLDCGF